MMSNENYKLIQVMERAIKFVADLPENTHVHTITVMVDGLSPSGISAKVEADRDAAGWLEAADPVTLV